MVRIRSSLWAVLPMLAMLVLPSAVSAEDGINTGDTAWMMVSCALVMLMTPGLAFFYGGMVRHKNVLSTFMMSFIALGVITLQWVIVGYSLAFGDDIGNFVGGFNFVMLNGVNFSPHPTYTGIPHLVFMLFQMMFAIITPALISGSMVERTKFGGYVLFILLWSTLVYDPVAHWVWGGGWLADKGALDFAGGTVVHLISGVSALVAAIYMGKRRGWPQQAMLPHNLGWTVLGAGILWFGWFGFNAGSALASNGGAAVAFATTHIASATAAVSWALVEKIHRGKASMLGVASGLVAGLVVITPAAGFVSPTAAIFFGAVVSPVCYGAIALLKPKFGYDDSLDAFGVHGVGGTLGAILTGVFANAVWGAASGYPQANGLLYGNAGQLMTQIIGCVVAGAYAAIVTIILLILVDKTVGLKVDTETELKGLDLTQHGEEAYSH